MSNKGRIKIAGRFVNPDSDFRIRAGDWSIFERGSVCVARRADGVEGRCQLSDNGPGNKSVQVFAADGRLIEDINTKFL